MFNWLNLIIMPIPTIPIWFLHKKKTKEEIEQQKRNDAITNKILQKKLPGQIKDAPLQEEHPLATVLMPLKAESKVAGSVLKGLGRTIGGLVGSYVGSNVGYKTGQKVDERLETKFFTPAGGFVGSLIGYGTGSWLTGVALNKIPQKVTYGPINERTYWAEEQLQSENIPEVTYKTSENPVLQISQNQKPLLTGHFGKVKYYAPTMGKTTASKLNSKLVDFDDIIRQPSKDILKRYGFASKADLYNSKNQEAIAAYENMLVKQLQDWRSNPENQGFTLMASPAAVSNPQQTGFYFDNEPSIPDRQTFIKRNVARGATPKESADWYDNLITRNPNLKIDNRFITDIEYIPPKATPGHLTWAEYYGFPKGERNNNVKQPRVVNRDGSINWVNLQKAYDRLMELKQYGWFPHDLFEEGINKGIGDASTLFGHTEGVVKSALQIPVPKGSSRSELVRAALVHDIGKLETGQEHSNPNHGYVSEYLLDKLGFPEFTTPTVKSAVRYHMANGKLDEWNNSGIKREPRWGLPYEMINYDLLKALQAADVARGLSYDKAAAKYPQLFRYETKEPFKVKFYQGTPEEQVKNVINPIFKREGYPTIKLSKPIDEQLIPSRIRHRSFFRGVTQPNNKYGLAQRQLNEDNLRKQAIDFFGEDTPENRLKSAALVTSIDPTGGWKAFAIDVKQPQTDFEVTQHGPTHFSKYLKFSPLKEDALFVNLNGNTLSQYSNNQKEGAILGYLPFSPKFSDEQPIDFLIRTEFPMFDGNKINGEMSPMSYWQKYEYPYRVQTGRSLQSDMGKEFTGTKWKRTGRWSIGHLDLAQKVNAELEKMGLKYRILVDPQKGAFIHNDLIPYYRALLESDLDTKTTLLKNLKLISDKQTKWKRWIPKSSLTGEIDTFNKYVWNNSTIKKLLKVLYKPSKFKLTKDYFNYLYNEDSIIKFMREHGVSPVWEMPYFKNTAVFGAHSSFGEKPMTKNKKFIEKGEGFIIAPKNTQVLEYLDNVDPKAISFGRWTDSEMYPVTRKTFKQGGILKGQSGLEKVPTKKDKPKELIPVKGSRPQTPPYPSVLPKESFIDKLRKRWAEMRNETRRPNAFGKFVITREGTKVVDDGGKIA